MVADSLGIGMTSQRARNRLAEQLRSMGISNDVILEIIRTTPRHLFVDEALASRAYENTALPIGYGQTISQPYIVATMTQALYLSAGWIVFWRLVAGVAIRPLCSLRLPSAYSASSASKRWRTKLRSRLHDLRINNVRVRHGDGFQGLGS